MKTEIELLLAVILKMPSNSLPQDTLRRFPPAEKLLLKKNPIVEHYCRPCICSSSPLLLSHFGSRCWQDPAAHTSFLRVTPKLLLFITLQRLVEVVTK